MASKKVRFMKPEPREILIESASLVMAKAISETTTMLSLLAPSPAPITQPSSFNNPVEVALRALPEPELLLKEGPEGGPFKTGRLLGTFLRGLCS